MKKALHISASITALLLGVATPAMAADGINLGITGYMAGYAAYTTQDDFGSANSYRNFDLRKDVKVTFTGSTKLENGTTVGATVTAYGNRADARGDFTVEHSYMYFSGDWGRVNFGETDGIGYLLQVAAPYADVNIDGISPILNTVALSSLSSAGGVTDAALNYKQVLDSYKSKVMYMTPLFSGFQAGIGVTPSIGEGDLGPTTALTVDNDTTGYDLGYEVAARYKGEFDAFDLTVGGGYSHAGRENTSATLESRDLYNLGAVFSIGAFDLGAAYAHDDNGVKTNGDTRNIVLGAAYKSGAFKYGLNWLNREDEASSSRNSTGAKLTTNRYTGGATYEYGPGMQFRGSVSYVTGDSKAAGAQDGNATQVLLGTVITF